MDRPMVRDRNRPTFDSAEEFGTRVSYAQSFFPPTGTSTRRYSIVSAARSLYEEKGLARTTIQDITNRVGVSRSLFYHYFSDKDAVTSAVLDAYIAEFLEALHHWNESRREGEIEQALANLVRLLRMGLFKLDGFRIALASRENAALYLEFVSRIADQAATYLLNSTARDYRARHEVRIQHLYETIYMLTVGIIGFLRKYPDADNQVVADLIAQTLHLDRGSDYTG